MGLEGLEWQRCLGGSISDYAYSIQPTSDRGYIVAGETSSNDGNVSGNHGSSDFWVVKLNSLGAIQWQKCLGGSSGDWAYSISRTTEGGYIAAGVTSSNDGNVSGNHGSADFWVVKLNSLGAIQWQKCLGGSGWDEARSVEQTSDGGSIVAGTTNSNDGNVSGNHGSADFWVVKLGSDGAMQWQKSLGGSGWDEARSLEQTSDGGYIVAGTTNSNDGNVSGNHGSSDFWVVKLASLGAIQWQKCLGGSSDDEAGSVEQTSDGGYIVAGATNSNDGNVSDNHGGSDFWVVKLNSSGAIQWQKCLGGSDLEGAYGILQTSDGGYIVAGSTNSNDRDVSGNQGRQDCWAAKLDLAGSILWQKYLGGSNDDEARSIRQTADGGYVIAGSTQSSDGDVSGYHLESGGDFWIVKIGPYLAPVITVQPTDQTVCEGKSALFNVTASSTGTISYQWMHSGSSISGAISSILSISSVKPEDAGSYSVDVTNMYGTTTTSAASLTVISLPKITSQPANQTVCEGWTPCSGGLPCNPNLQPSGPQIQTVTFGATADSAAPLSYQWKKGGLSISGATSSTLSISPVKPDDAGSYTVDVTNILGTVNSEAAILTVNRLPWITSQPANQTVLQGQTALLSVVADGTIPLSYQWKKDGVAISGATSPTLSLSSVKLGDAGAYAVDVINACGTITSKAATLTVK